MKEIMAETRMRVGRMVYVLTTILCLLIFLPLFTWIRYVLVPLGRIKIYHMERFPDVEKEGAIFIVNHPTYLEPPLVYLLFVLFWYKATIKAGIKGAYNVLSFKVLTIEDLEKEVEDRLKEIERFVPKATVADKYQDLPIALIFPLILLVKKFAFVRIDRSKGKKGARNRVNALFQLGSLLRKEKRSVVLPAEGTRQINILPENIATSPKGNRVGVFEPGAVLLALRTGIPLTPVGFLGTEKVLPNNKLALPLLFVAYFLPILPGKGTIEINIGFPCPIPKEISLGYANEKARGSMLTTLDEIT